MKKTICSIASLIAIAAIIVTSCQKNYNSNGKQVSLNKLFADLRSTPQSLSVQAGRDTVVYGAKGTMLHFYANSFKDAAGNIITGETIAMQLVEMYSAGDMIQNRATTTTADGLPLMSGGQINLKATLNGQEVFANKYGIGFKQSVTSSQPMELYYGTTSNSDSVVKWNAGGNGTGEVAAGTDTISAWYIFDSCKHFNFTNCDHPFTSGSVFTPILITLPGSSFGVVHGIPDRLVNTQIFMSFSSYRTVVGIYPQSYIAGTETADGGYCWIPQGTSYKMLLIANKNGSYYYYQTSGVVSADTIRINATMSPETRGDIIDRLMGL